MKLAILGFVQFGQLLMMCGLVNALVSAGLYAFKQTPAAKHLIATAAGLAVIGLLCLALVAFLGVVGVLNA
jgi:hypothetical protein